MEDINIALLIDADNISSKYIPVILSELSKYGKITIRRMYGDWSQERLRSWLGCSAGYSLTPVMQPNNTPGKNASDIGLIIDAMDTLYADSVQGFCIVSSDGDFNKLATRLRESGKVVIGMGEKKTPESFRVSCERFIFLDVIIRFVLFLQIHGHPPYKNVRTGVVSNYKRHGKLVQELFFKKTIKKLKKKLAICKTIYYNMSCVQGNATQDMRD